MVQSWFQNPPWNQDFDVVKQGGKKCAIRPEGLIDSETQNILCFVAKLQAGVTIYARFQG